MNIKIFRIFQDKIDPNMKNSQRFVFLENAGIPFSQFYPYLLTFPVMLKNALIIH